MAADLRKCYSEDDLPTTPWRFPLSFIPFLVLYVFLSKVRMSPKVTIACNGFCLLRHAKAWLARDIISYSGTMFSRILTCTLLHRELRDYSLGQITFTVFQALFAIAQLLCHVSTLPHGHEVFFALLETCACFIYKANSKPSVSASRLILL